MKERVQKRAREIIRVPECKKVHHRIFLERVDKVSRKYYDLKMFYPNYLRVLQKNLITGGSQILQIKVVLCTIKVKQFSDIFPELIFHSSQHLCLLSIKCNLHCFAETGIPV